MTEYEVIDAADSVMANFLTAYSVFLTILTAYVVAAFTAGARFTRLQLTFLNVLFIAAASLTLVSAATMVHRALDLNLRTPYAGGSAAHIPPAVGAAGTLVLGSAMIGGCLWFMRSARRTDR